MTNATTVLAEIHTCIGATHRQASLPRSWQRQLELDKLHKRAGELQEFALQHFAGINGWKLTSKGFSAKYIGRRYSADMYYLGPPEFYDHVEHFRDVYRRNHNAAIVMQPYRFAKTVEDCLRAARVYAEHLELGFHVPANPFASVWYPGATLFFVFTEPDRPVYWLPEQESGAAFQEPEAA
jgi:hypothetical protein